MQLATTSRRRRTSWFFGLLLLLLTAAAPSSSYAQYPFRVVQTYVGFDAYVGQGIDLYLPVRSNMQQDITLTMTLGGADAASFTVESPLTIPYTGDSSEGSIILHFEPTEERGYIATVDVTDGMYTQTITLNAKAHVVVPYISGPHSWIAPLGATQCQKVYVGNPGTAPMQITSLSLQNSPTFSVSGAPALPVVLGANESINFDVCFSPVTTDYAIDTLSVSYQSGGTAGTALHAIYGTFPMLNGPCIVIAGDSVYGFVNSDMTVVHDFKLTNLTNGTLTITQQSQGDPHFKIIGIDFPHTLGPNDDASFSVKLYSGNDNMKQYFRDYIAFTATDSLGQRCYDHLYLSANAQYTAQPVDSTLYGLDVDKKDKLKIEGAGGNSYRIFKFYNSTSSALKVISVAMKKGDDFSVRPLFNPPQEELPITLAPGEVLLVRIDITNPNPGDYKDDLEIVTEAGLVAITFPVEGTRVASDVAPLEPKAAPRIVLSSNPAREAVAITVQGLRQTHVEIIDIMGKVVASFDGNSFKWNASSEDRAASSSYIVRASGIRENGHPYITSKRLQIIR